MLTSHLFIFLLFVLMFAIRTFVASFLYNGVIQRGEAKTIDDLELLLSLSQAPTAQAQVFVLWLLINWA